MIFNQYPYTDGHELNLDWILGEIKRLHHAMTDFEAANHIKPCGIWDITKQYEAWSVVTDGGAGYISTRPVPVGIDISNLDYWTPIVDYDAFWGSLDLRIQTLEGQMSTLNNTTIPNINGDISALDGRIDDAEDDIDTLEGSMSTLIGTTIPGIQSDITNLSNRLGLLDNRKFIFIADSYAGTSDYVTKVNAALGLTDGVNSFCNAVGGEGFTKGTGGNGYLYELQIHAGYMGDALKQQITDIFVIGGANDAEDNQSYGTNTIAANFATFVNYAKTNFPNAKIHVGFIGFCWFTSPTLENRTQTNLELMCYYYKDTAISSGCAYMTDIEYTTRWLSENTSNADRLHPNSVGGVIIAQGIVQYILGGHIMTSVEGYDIDTNTVINNGSLTMKFSMHNNQASVEVPELPAIGLSGLIQAGDAASNYSDRTHICYFSRIFFNKPVTALGFMFISGTAPYVFPIEYMFYGNELTAMLFRANGTGWEGIIAAGDVVVFAPFVARFDSIALG